MNIEKRLQQVLKECERLQAENNYLKNLLEKNQISYLSSDANLIYEDDVTASKAKIINKRITIFKSLFKGRTDVFAVRYADKGGSGYKPVRERNSQKYVPLTNQEIYDHLIGKQTIGIYPLLENNMCYFLAFDFDKGNWVEDVKSLIAVCRKFEVPTSLEISRSGNGCHLWIFFLEMIPASLARELGKFLLNHTRRNLTTFDRMFPTQDFVQKGGVGNLIALPLQYEPRKNGNSLFIDDNFKPFSDQWGYLVSIKRLSKANILNILKSTTVETLEIKMPEQLSLTFKNGIHIKKFELPSEFLSKLIKTSTFGNPEFFKAQAKRYTTYRIPRFIDCSQIENDTVILPRGCFENINKIAKEHSLPLKIEDKRNVGEKIDVQFYGQLTYQQEEAVEAMVKHDCGVLAADTGFGKTVTSAAIIAKNKVNTLVIVHRTRLIDQWIDRLSEFLKIPSKEIGQIGGGKNKATGVIDVATIQSLNRKDGLRSEITQYGQIIVDECHSIPALSFEKVLKSIRAKNVYGLTATPIRKDGLHPIIFMQCGLIRYKTDPKKQAKIRSYTQTLVVKNTSFKTNETDIQKVFSSISLDDHRNVMIFNDVLLSLEKKRSPIILTERLEHIEELKKRFKGFAKNIIILSGAMKKKERNEAMQRLLDIPDTEERLLIATGKYIGEGFDDPRLDTLFLTMPISWKGTLQQYVGRLHRNHWNKSEVKVYDYVDKQVPSLLKMFEKRLSGYKVLGYKTEDDKKSITDGEQMQLF